MRGVIQWIDSCLLGRPCRGMLAALIVARQYYERAEAHELTPTLRQALLYLKAALLAAQGRVISISSAAPAQCSSTQTLQQKVWTLNSVHCSFHPWANQFVRGPPCHLK
eukprot:4458872-Amphidinium_carterae.1